MSELISNPQPGDILLFYNPHTFLGRLNTIFSRSPFYHIGIYDAGEMVIESRPRGVVRRPIYGKIGGHDFFVIAAPPGIGRLAREWAVSRVGMPYDWWGLVIIFSHLYLHREIPHRPKRKYTCADFVARAYLQAGIDFFPGQNPSALLPADFTPFLPESEGLLPVFS